MKKVIFGLLLTVCAMGLFAQDLTLYSPVNYQVFQRQTKSKGYVFVSGNTAEKSINLKIKGNNWQDKEIIIEKNIKPDKYGDFSFYIEMPAGGWYRFQFRYGKDGFKEVDNVGVGEIILGSGQSNATNASSFLSKTESGMVASSDGVNWKLADDPQLGVHDASVGGSLYPSLGDALYKEFHVPVGVAPAGAGASYIDAWLPESDLFWNSGAKPNVNCYDYFIHRVAQFGKGGFRCVIWHQGESNFDADSDYYYTTVKKFIDCCRRDAGWNIPFFVAQASYMPPYGTSESTRAGQKKLWEAGVAFQGPDTDVLGKEYRDYDGNGVHLNLEGLKKHGEMWAEYIIPYIHSQID